MNFFPFSKYARILGKEHNQGDNRGSSATPKLMNDHLKVVLQVEKNHHVPKAHTDWLTGDVDVDVELCI